MSSALLTLKLDILEFTHFHMHNVHVHIYILYTCVCGRIFLKFDIFLFACSWIYTMHDAVTIRIKKQDHTPPRLQPQLNSLTWRYKNICIGSLRPVPTWAKLSPRGASKTFFATTFATGTYRSLRFSGSRSLGPGHLQLASQSGCLHLAGIVTKMFSAKAVVGASVTWTILVSIGWPWNLYRKRFTLR